MLSIDRPVIVEGKYDKIRLSSVINGIIICTDGFGIFRNSDKMRLIRHYAAETGIIILTDSDSAGFKIRGYLKGAVPEGSITNVYIPDIFGKERRKKAPSKEGKLGVEGMDEETLLKAFEKAGVVNGSRKSGGITRTLLYELGYSGTYAASERRRRLLAALELPCHLTAGALCELLDTMLDAEELTRLTRELFGEKLSEE